jgi:hypothetical protein
MSAAVMIAEAIAAGKLRRILTSMSAFDPITKKPLASNDTMLNASILS